MQDSSDLCENIYFTVRWSVAQNCHFLAGKQINSLAQCQNFNKLIAFLEVNLHLFTLLALLAQCSLL